MRSELQIEDVKLNASNQQPQVAAPKQAENDDAKLPSALATTNALPAEVSNNAHLTFANATISITTPSIVITPSTSSEGNLDGSEVERKKYEDSVNISFNKYEEQQEKLIAVSYEKSDGLLLTISSTILALSATFITSLLGNKHSVKYLWELHTGWTFLIATIVSVLVSYFAARNSLLKTVEAARLQKDSCLSEDADEQNLLTKKSEELTKNRETSRKWTEGLNIAGTVAFVTGLVFIVVFATTNI